MADNNEFILSLIGELDEGKTKANVQKALENISKNVSLNSKNKAVKNAITVFDKEQLEKDGIAYLKSAKDIESQLGEIFKGIGTSFEVKQTLSDDGSIEKFTAKIYDGTKAIQSLNFEAAKFSDGTFGFRQVGGTFNSGKISTEIKNEIEALKSENKQLDLQDVLITRLHHAKQMLNDGSISSDSLKFSKLNEDIRLLENQINSIDFSKIGSEGENHLNEVVKTIYKAVEAEHKLYNVRMDKKTGVFNIPVLEKEGTAFYDNTVGVVERVKQELEGKGYLPKMSILSRDSEGGVTAFTAEIKNASGVVDTLYYDLVRLNDGTKTFDGFMSSYGKQIDNTSREYAKALEKQTKDLAKAKTDLNDLMTKFLTGNGNKVLTGDERTNDILNKLIEAETIINRLNSNAGYNTPDQIDGIKNYIKEIKKEADEYVNLENKQNKISQAYENQKYKLEALSQEARKLYDATFNGKNNLVDEKNITNAQNKLKNLSLFIDGLYTKHNKGDIIPEDALIRFDLKLKEITQDIKNMKDKESLQKALIGNTESQLNALNTIENKILSIQSKMLDGNKITTPSYISDISNQTANALNTIETLRNKAGSITDAESRNLTNIVATLQREADEYARIDAAQQKSNENLRKQINKFAEMERSLESFKAKYYGLGTGLSDPFHLEIVTSKLQELDGMMSMFKANAGNITDAQINEYKNLRNELDATADRYAKLEAIQNKETQTIEDQKYILYNYYLELKRINDTALNPNSSLTLTNSDEIKKVTDSFTELEKRYQDLSKRNKDGEIINKSELKEVDLLLKEINQDINIIGKEKNSNNDFNNNMITTRANLNLLIGDLERDGKLVGDIKTQITEFVKEIARIKSPEELDNFNARLKAFRTNFTDLQRDEKAAFDNNQLNQKLQILSSQINGYMQQNTRAATMFKSSFDELKLGIKSARTNEDLLKLQNDFKLLQQNINNAGKAGLTFGERMSAAVKKFMMWTGMTNVVMLLIRNIRQMITHTKELDSAMVSLKKVTDETDTVYKQMFVDATEKAKELNTSIKDIINSTAEFAKLGFDTKQAQELAEVANVYANVAEIDAETASKTLVSTINGFKDLTVDNAWDIADIINNISNKFATSGADLGDILQRSSAALSEANNDLNESIALGTVAQTINQDASRVGKIMLTLNSTQNGGVPEVDNTVGKIVLLNTNPVTTTV